LLHCCAWQKRNRNLKREGGGGVAGGNENIICVKTAYIGTKMAKALTSNVHDDVSFFSVLLSLPSENVMQISFLCCKQQFFVGFHKRRKSKKNTFKSLVFMPFMLCTHNIPSDMARQT
jgi:hypothetical protein